MQTADVARAVAALCCVSCLAIAQAGFSPV
jgi:hypothetical protein